MPRKSYCGTIMRVRTVFLCFFMTGCSIANSNSLPKVVHQTLQNLKPGRLIVIGDVHGCHVELEKLLWKVHYQGAHDNLIFTGDLVNKGPASVQVLRTFRTLDANAVRGNHDDAALQRYHKWKNGDKALPEKHMWVTEMDDLDAHLLGSLPFTLSVPSYGLLVVHSGLLPDTPLQQQDLWACYKMRNLVEGDGYVQPRWTAVENVKQGDAWANFWLGPEHVIFGHDAKRRLQLHPYATGLDTGCCYGGQLTALVVPPLSQLQCTSSAFSSKLHKKPLTLQDLQAELVSVEAEQVYVQPTSS